MGHWWLGKRVTRGSVGRTRVISFVGRCGDVFLRLISVRVSPNAQRVNDFSRCAALCLVSLIFDSCCKLLRRKLSMSRITSNLRKLEIINKIILLIVLIFRHRFDQRGKKKKKKKMVRLDYYGMN